mgnify:CR=1 FL=1|jgi:hypothetical protein
MVDEKGPRYYAALAASTVSSAGWVGAVVGTLYMAYRFATTGTVGSLPFLVVGAVIAGAVFALVEKRLYSLDDA